MVVGSALSPDAQQRELARFQALLERYDRHSGTDRPLLA
jgi:hypothetical protein